MPEFYGRLTGPFFKELVPGSYISKFGLIGLLFLLINVKNKKNQYILVIFYLTLIGSVTYISGERMALATFLLGIVFLSIFYKNMKIIFLISIFIIILSNILITNLHPSYNDYKIIESKPHHLGLKVKKEFICNNNEKKCSKIINLQPGFVEVLKNFEQSTYGQIYKLSYKMWKKN